MRAGCRRCGICCGKGGPVLHAEDLPPAARGVFPPAALLTLRAGEMAWDEVRGESAPLAEETIKIADAAAAARACPFFDARARACAVYAARPAQCRAFFCAEPSALAAMYTKDRLRRSDLLPLLHAGWRELAGAHESECSWARLAPAALRALRDAGAAAALLEAVRFDQAFRELAVERAAVPPEALPLLFGRPLAKMLADFGLAEARAPDGGARLVPSGLCLYPDTA